MEYHGLTDIGQRPSNQDAFAVRELPGGLLLAVVADGCGEACGVAELAAGRLVSEASSGVRASCAEDMSRQLSVAVASVNNYVVEYRRCAPAMGYCCLTAAIINPPHSAIAIAHVGDTRCYVGHDGLIVKLTRDNSPVGRMLDCGLITAGEASRHPMRHQIDRALGQQILSFDTHFISSYTCSYEPGDTLMLCTDGIYDGLLQFDIGNILGMRVAPGTKADTLLNMARDGRSTDNATVVVIDL